MRPLLVLVLVPAFAFPCTVAAQLYPMLPQPGLPGAGVPMGTGIAGPTIVAPVQGGAVILNPGQAPGYVLTPNSSWGTGVVTPGNAPSYILPNNAGGTAIVTPGYGTTLVRPNPAGGTTIVGPEFGTTLVVPTQRGGAAIIGPGGTGYVVPTPQGAFIQPPGGLPPTVIYRP